MANAFKSKRVSHASANTSQKVFEAVAANTLVKSIMAFDTAGATVTVYVKKVSSGEASTYAFEKIVLDPNVGQNLLLDILALEATDEIWIASTTNTSVYLINYVEEDGVIYGQSVKSLADWSNVDPTDGQLPVWSASLGEYVPSSFSAGGVTSVNGETGSVILDASDIKRSGSTGDTIATDLTQLENFATTVSAILKNPSSSVTGIQVDDNNKIQIDSVAQKTVVTIDGVTAATLGKTQALLPAVRIGATGTTYDLPSSRGTATGQVPVFDATTNTTSFKSVEVSDLSGDSDDITEGTTNLFLTSAERTKLGGIAAGAEVNVNADWNATTGDAQILNKPTLAAVATTGSYTDLSNKPTIVSSVTGTAPIVSSGGTTPAISISAATTSAAGSMSSADKSKLDGIAAGAEVNQNAFSNVAVSGQTTVAADGKTDTLTLVAGSNITLTTDAATDSITISSSGGGGGSDSFNTIAVSGQSDIVADSGNDTLTFAAAGGVTLTTNATTDTLTISSRTLDDDDVTLSDIRTIDVNGEALNIVNGADAVATFSETAQVLAQDVRITGGAAAGVLRIFEAAANGNNYVTIQAPTLLGANVTFTLPSADGTPGQLLQTNGSGGLSFVTKKVTQVTGKTVATGAWSLVSGIYEASISDSAILSTSIVNIIPDNGSAATIRTAQMLPRTDSSTGSVKIYSTNLPTASITVTLNIFDL